jgi:hypothetical protein
VEWEVRGLERLRPRPDVLALPAGFDPPLTAGQLALADAGSDD